MAIQRGPLVVVVSNFGGNGTKMGFNVPTSNFKQGVQLLDLLNCEKAMAGCSGNFTSGPVGGQARVSASKR
jgi:hypothetical protein